MIRGIIVKHFSDPLGNKSSYEKAFVTLDNGKTVSATCGSFAYPIGSDARTEAVERVCEKAGLVLLNNDPVWISPRKVMFHARNKNNDS